MVLKGVPVVSIDNL